MRSHTLVQVRLSVIVILNLIQEPDEDTLKLTTRPFLLPPRLNPFPPFPLFFAIYVPFFRKFHLLLALITNTSL